MSRIELTVSCNPVGQPRPQPTIRRGKGGKVFPGMFHPDSPGKSEKARKRAAPYMAAKAFSDAIQTAVWQSGLRPSSPWSGPIRLDYDVFFERPKYMLAKKFPDSTFLHTAKPDRDNLEKPIMDALKKAGLLVDDCFVCEGEPRKWYAARGCGPGVRIVVTRIGSDHPGYCGFIHEEKPR